MASEEDQVGGQDEARATLVSAERGVEAVSQISEGAEAAS